MAEFHFFGRLTLDNVTFMIDAESIQEARKIALEGRFDNWEVSPACEAVDWEIRLAGSRENK